MIILWSQLASAVAPPFGSQRSRYSALFTSGEISEAEKPGLRTCGHQPDSPCCLQTQRPGHRPPAQRQADSLAWPSRHACLLRSLPQTQNTTFQISLRKSALPGKSGSCLCWLSPQLGRLSRRKGSRGCRRERENIGLIFREHASKDFQQQRLMTDLLLANTAFCS